MLPRLRSFFAAGGTRRMVWTALAVRLLYITLAHTFRIRPTNDHFEFGWEMGRIARSLATGHGFADPFNGHTGPTAWTPPLYPLLLALVFKVFGVYTRSSAWVILAINSVFGALTVPAVYELARRIFARDPDTEKIALWSGWLWALYPAALQFDVRWVWDMALTACLFAWVLVLALRLRDAATTQRWLAFGLLWGAIALSNSSLLLFLPFAIGWIAWPSPRTYLRGATLALVCTFVLMAPWIARNWLAFRAFVPMRSNFGAELYQSADPLNEGYPIVASLAVAQNDPQLLLYGQLGELAYSREQGARAVALIREHRGTFAANILKRVWFFWVSVPHPTGGTAAGLVNETAREMSYAFISLSGLGGLALALRRRIPGASLALFAVATLPLLYYVVTVQARFRHPLEPLLCVFAVYLFRNAERNHA